MFLEQKVECYNIIPKNFGNTSFIHIKELNMYAETIVGFKRKAYVTDNQFPEDDQPFTDPSFQIQKSKDYILMRLHELCDNETELFPNTVDYSLIDHQHVYNTFVAECGLLDINYVKTLIMANQVKENGYYRYFVKRHGEYYLDYVDDIIPVVKERKRIQPLWGLSLKFPWQLILLKAWLKEKKTWQKFNQAAPFQFLDAFGLAGYKNFNFRKQIRFLKEEKQEQINKEQKIRSTALNSKTAVILAKSVNSEKIRKVGLPPNLIAFKILLLSSDVENIYHVQSSVPVGWTGKHSLISKNQLQGYMKEVKLDLQKSFVMTQSEVLKYFNKFYVVPKISLEFQRLKLQDTFIVNNNRQQNWIKFNVQAEDDGLCTISFELPRSSYDYRQVYPDIKYFISKKNTAQEIYKSHFREDLKQSQVGLTHYIESDCDKWENFQIEFQQGYFFNSTSFNRLQKGQYIIYAKVSPQMPYRIRFNSQVPISEPQFTRPSLQQQKTIFDSTFYQISQDIGIQTSLQHKSYEESIVLANTFDQIGFGVICIKTLANARHKIALRIFPKLLRQNGLDLLDHYYEEVEGGNQKNMILISERGKPETVVFKRLDRSDRNALNKPFPPPETVQFFKLKPKEKEKEKSEKGRRSSRSKSQKSKDKNKKQKSKLKKSKRKDKNDRSRSKSKSKMSKSELEKSSLKP